MDWDQIESKWAAMTRRVGGDLSNTKVDATGKVLRRVAKTDATTGIAADPQPSISLEQQTPMTAQ